jgi:DNA invertase Pin-like site-specific DNA recombinase
LQKIYCDQGLSGASSKRPALNKLLKACRRGSVDVVVVWKFDRFARSLKQLMSGLETCRALGIDFVSVTEAVDTSLPAGELVFQMIGAVAQFERSLIAERVKSGLANARANGRTLGRPPLRKLTLAEARELRRQRVQDDVPFKVLANKFGRVGLDSPQTVSARKRSLDGNVWSTSATVTRAILQAVRKRGQASGGVVERTGKIVPPRNVRVNSVN